jgi:CRISPR-associated endonuclease/helicase Cas3
MREQLLKAYAEGTYTACVKVKSNSYPLLTHLTTGNVEEFPVEARSSASRRVESRPLHSIEEVKTMLHDILDTGGCACWVRNTVFDALQAYREWVDLLDKDKVILFHARFSLGDRLTIEQKVIGHFGQNSTREQRQGKLLIATQVVEQSLDIDFDLMVTDLAPIDLIIQRAGRLQRHARGPRNSPVLGVFMPKVTVNADKNWFKNIFPKVVKVYDHHGQLWLTAKWLSEHKGFTMPENARNMIESVYGESAQTLIPEGLQTAETLADGEDRADASLGSLNSLNLNEGYKATFTHWQDDAYAPTRLGEPTVMVRLVRWDDTRLTPWFINNAGHDWELSQVSIRKSLIAKEDIDYLAKAVAVAKDTMPDKGEYCVVIPLVQSNGKWVGQALNSRGEKVSIMYNNDTGLEITKGENDESD